MRYLVYFRPNYELSNLIEQQEDILLPNSGLHGTICHFHMNSTPFNERQLFSILSKIQFEPFIIKTEGFDIFNNDSLVLKLKGSPGLISLHERITTMAKYYDSSEEFDYNCKHHYFKHYIPHFTIRKPAGEITEGSLELLGIKDTIESYFLSKKEGSTWKHLGEFHFKANYLTIPKETFEH